MDISKGRFRNHKRHIHTGKERFGAANHLLNVCYFSASKSEYLQAQLIEKVFVQIMTILTKFCGKDTLISAIIYIKVGCVVEIASFDPLKKQGAPFFSLTQLLF